MSDDESGSDVDWSDWARLRGLIVVVVMFLVSGYMFYGELRYTFGGRFARGVVQDVFTRTMSGTPDPNSEHRYVRYRFTDLAMDGVMVVDEEGRSRPAMTQRTEADSVEASWKPPADGIIDVQYVPGLAGWSRVAGHTMEWLCAPFLGSLGMGMALGRRFWKDYREQQNRRADWRAEEPN